MLSLGAHRKSGGHTASARKRPSRPVHIAPPPAPTWKPASRPRPGRSDPSPPPPVQSAPASGVTPRAWPGYKHPPPPHGGTARRPKLHGIFPLSARLGTSTPKRSEARKRQ
ncbi:hypothetical protein PVAP13_2KG576059 [Panicum virgatum]|uniref:Uncharacterized protein n=1 Tax=Panicum virgatum TaxID=38727 RepID=A0A8T0WNP4_PANVG|nr:hypothetical protein PVAP13_2KG576059 [Panicum virgatum]